MARPGWSENLKTPTVESQRISCRRLEELVMRRKVFWLMAKAHNGCHFAWCLDSIAISFQIHSDPRDQRLGRWSISTSYLTTFLHGFGCEITFLEEGHQQWRCQFHACNGKVRSLSPVNMTVSSPVLWARSFFWGWRLRSILNGNQANRIWKTSRSLFSACISCCSTIRFQAPDHSCPLAEFPRSVDRPWTSLGSFPQGWQTFLLLVIRPLALGMFWKSFKASSQCQDTRFISYNIGYKWLW